ncbi:MAG: N-acetylmuramoyl-L-alanine amidase [Armatimonadetes bacterium]|nr:N-acetylmuramoyl-L-alanine amidase [Armatimonadota bacterium]
MRSALIALLPGMAMSAAAGQDGPVPVTLSYAHRLPALEAPALRVGDECFLPVSEAGRIGWTVESDGDEARVSVHGLVVETFIRDLDGRPYLPLRTVVEAAGGLSEWTQEQRLQVYSKITRITVKVDRIEIEGTLPVTRSFLVLDGPKRVAFDIKAARLDPNDPPEVTGEVRYAQFDPVTVRVVAQVQGEPNVSQVAGDPARPILRWTGASTVPIEAIEFPPKPAPLLLGEPILEVDTEERTVIRLPFQGPAPGKLAAYRDPDGVFWVDLPSGERLEGWQQTSLRGRVVLSAELVERGGGGLRLRLELERPMGVHVSARDSELVVRLVRAEHAYGSLAEKTIVVDPGHGGRDAGAQHKEDGERLDEKDLNLAVARIVADLLSESGSTVVMTRNDDYHVGVYDRPEMANASEAHFFISIHFNSNPTPNSRSGTFTYYHSDDTDSKLLAECILGEISKVSGLPSNGAMSDYTVHWRGEKKGFAVLRSIEMPGVLVEIAYLNNDTDRKRLLEPEFQRAVAEAIVKGIEVYIGNEA